MADPLTALQQAQPDWLLIPDHPAPQPAITVTNLALQRYQALQAHIQTGYAPRILLVTADPIDFIASFLAAVTAHCPIFLGNPIWSPSEWQQVLALAQPDLIWGTPPVPLPGTAPRFLQLPPQSILIPTGGSSGQIRFALHTWQTLTASVTGFRQYFSQSQVNSCCLLPLYHVSGLMQLLRSLLSGGQLALLPRSLSRSVQATIDPTHSFISLVPTQLQRILEQPNTTHWLSRFQTILLGGAPAWAELLEQARRHHLPLAPTYGMTETASQVATLKPEEFLNGRSGCGQSLPHAEITIRDASGQLLPSGQIGQVTIQAQSLYLGYYSPDIHWEEAEDAHPFQTDDLGYLDAEGYLHIVGRSSHKIITGGENVFPAEVEASLYATGLVREVYVLGLPDRHWGEVVTAVYVPSQADVTVMALRAALSPRLSKFKHPKHWVAVTQLPRNAQGKINRQHIQEMLKPPTIAAIGAESAPSFDCQR